ncbi:Paraquat-inducible protein A [Rhizobium sp. RU36D]|nr:Paraquat-inducible protein A [Rhizobium sp. RU36D]
MPPVNFLISFAWFRCSVLTAGSKHPCVYGPFDNPEFRVIWFHACLLMLAPFFLALGLTMPLVRFEKLYFFSETPALTDIVLSLWQGGNALLSVLVASLSIVFPIFKLVGIAAEMMMPPGGRGGTATPVAATSLALVDDGRAAGCGGDLRGQDKRIGSRLHAARSMVLRRFIRHCRRIARPCHETILALKSRRS